MQVWTCVTNTRLNYIRFFIPVQQVLLIQTFWLHSLSVWIKTLSTSLMAHMVYCVVRVSQVMQWNLCGWVNYIGVTSLLNSLCMVHYVRVSSMHTWIPHIPTLQCILSISKQAVTRMTEDIDPRTNNEVLINPSLVSVSVKTTAQK